MIEAHKLDLDNVTYTMTPANAMASWAALKAALGLLNSIDLKSLDTKDEPLPVDATDEEKKAAAEAAQKRFGLAIISTLAANLGHPAIKQMEEIVLKHTSAQVDGGKPYRLSNDLDAHFNKYRSHLINVLLAGLKYQFGDFFTGGGGLLNSMKSSIKAAI